MSARYAGTFYSRRLVVVSSDNDIFDCDNLPPSDPPEDDEDDEPMLADAMDSDRNPFLTSDDIPFDHSIFPSSEDVPLALVLRGHDYSPRRLRSSSLPTTNQARTAMAPSDHDIMFTPNTERKHRRTLITQKRLETFSHPVHLATSTYKQRKYRYPNIQGHGVEPKLKSFQQSLRSNERKTMNFNKQS